ncbi:MAG: pyrroloquinoline quinone-dependent dehydrogenase, partial [Pseudomonadales bacterium]
MRVELPKIAFAACIALTSVFPAMAASTGDWDRYGGDGGQQFTPLDQINPDNLDRLQEAWVFRTGDLNETFARKAYSFQTNPIFWNGLLFISTSANWVIALNAVTGEELWRFDPQIPRDIGYSESASRGVSLWHGDSLICPDRIFIGTLVGEVHALDALTGEPCNDFGDHGRVDMSKGVGDVDIGDYGITSPPAVMGDQIIVGSAVGDNRAVESERGIVRALDARTGTLNWLWDPIPRSADDPAYSTWEDGSAAITGAANAWAPLSVDEARGLVYVSTSSPSPDFYGGKRLGDNRYANSLVALRGSTGEVVWHQQLVHHDVWDYDIPSQPTLTTMQVGSESMPAVLVVTKTGMLYGFHRDTGEPLIDMFERPVPASDVPGERLSPTQPFSAIAPLSEQRALTADDAFGIAWFDQRACAHIIESFRSEGIFTPPSLRGSILNPSYAGGSNWGGVAVDESRQIAVTNVNQIPALVRLIPRAEIDRVRATGELDGWGISRMTGTPYFMARRIFLSPIGLPCTRPPWGKLVAVDLASQTILWDVPLGRITDIAPAPVPNFEWGVPNMGGPLLTRSGLIVIGAAAEHALRIFDTQTGEEL